MNAFFRKLQWFAHRHRREAEVREELEFHLTEEADERTADGLSDEQAQSAARRELGNVAAIAEDVRAAWTWPGFERMVQDLRFGLRGLRRSPGFTLVAVLTLGLAVGAATAMYAVVEGVVLRPLPYPRPEHLVQLRQLNESGQSGPFSDPNFEDLRAAGSHFDAMAEYSWALASVVVGSLPVRIGVAPVSQGFFDVLATSPRRGRRFAAEELREGGPRVAIVSDRFWRQYLSDVADLSLARLRLNGELTLLSVSCQRRSTFRPVQTSGRRENSARAIRIALVTTGRWSPGSRTARRSTRRGRRRLSWRNG